MSIVLTATSGLLGNFPLEQGGSLISALNVAGAAVGMTVQVSPQTYPGPGFAWLGYVSAPGVVTVVITSSVTQYLPGSVYSVSVLTSSGSGGPALEVNGTPNVDQALLNLIAGTGISLVDNGAGGVTIAATGAGAPAIFGPNISTPIVPANWTTVGSGGTRTDGSGNINCVGGTGGLGTTDIFGVSIPVAAGNFTHYVAVYANFSGITSFFSIVQVAFTDGSNFEGTGAGADFAALLFTNLQSTAYSGGTYVGVPGSTNITPGPAQIQLVIARLTRAGTTLSAALSFDGGLTYQTQWTDAVPFLTANAIMVYCDPRESTVAPSFTLCSFV